MAAELMLAADPDVIERSADLAEFVVQACQRAKAWLREALEHGEIEQIAEIKSHSRTGRSPSGEIAAATALPAEA